MMRLFTQEISMILRVILSALFLFSVWGQEPLPSLTLPGNGVSPKITWKDQKLKTKPMLSAFATDQCSIRLQEMKLPEAQGAITIIKPEEKTAPMPNLQVPAPSCAKAEKTSSGLVSGRP